MLCLGCSAVALAMDYDANDFASEVVSYIQGSGVGYDWLGNPYNNPQTALGRPTLLTTGDWSIGTGILMLVVPVYPAWRSFEVVTVGSGGKLILRFNHRVEDDENNPYGVDFIVFGNARWHIGSGGSWTPQSNPETVTVDSGFFREPGIVSVSQDGNNWYKFTTGPYADDFAPTASYKWDDVNNVWSDELDPTRPVDPNLTPASFNGKSVAEIIEMYNGSVGGTGFDLKWLAPNDYQALAVDPNTGQRWIQYVKIEDDPNSSGLPEVDAVADVSCCGDYKHPIVAGDINRDCRVDYRDLRILCDYWLAEISGPNDPAAIADIYEDYIVNFYDLALMAETWLRCNWECD
jgi:hypothetical protein